MHICVSERYIMFTLTIGLQVINYVIEKMVLDKPFEGGSSDGTFGLGSGPGQSQLSSIGDGSFRSGLKPWQKTKPTIEILCNNQASEEIIPTSSHYHGQSSCTFNLS